MAGDVDFASVWTGVQLAELLLPRGQTKPEVENQNSVLFLGIPVVYFAISYMPFFEERSCSRSQETRYGIEQMITRRVTSAKYVNIVHLCQQNALLLPFNRLVFAHVRLPTISQFPFVRSVKDPVTTG